MTAKRRPARPKVNQQTPIDRNGLHQLLWLRADRLGRVRFVQQDFAAEIGITKFTMSRQLAKMVDECRIRRLSRTGGSYVVIDPAEWKAVHG